jgi:ABC-2 type transport system ATP-binding protein
MPPEMPAAVELVDVSKQYGQVQALQHVTLTIAPGEVVAMLGPNGAGKTTSISLMLGTRQPTSGHARLFGLNPRDLRARSRIGVMLQESGVPGMLKVNEIVSLFGSYYPAPLPTSQAIAMAGLEEKSKSLVKDLSGGQRQRLYLALAVCGNPDVLFLDEPTVGMDVEGRRRFITEIAEFAAKGRTVVLTTHYLEEADQLARRVIVIDRGQVIADSTPTEIKSRVAGKHVTFIAARPMADADLDGLPLTGKQLQDNRVRLLTNDPETVLRELFRRGVEMRDLEVAGADLEEAFVAMTHRELAQ